MKIEISSRIIDEATTYISLTEKEKIASEVAENCIDTLQINIDNGGQLIAMPPMYRENTSMKARYLMGILAAKYLKMPIEPIAEDSTETLMDLPTYDAWASSHVYDQLERMKRNSGLSTETKNRIYEIMSDFRDIEKRINATIYSLIQVQNDICTRLVAMVEMMTTPETLTEAGKQLQNVKSNLDEYLKEKEKASNNV